jgi:acetyl esterase
MAIDQPATEHLILEFLASLPPHGPAPSTPQELADARTAFVAFETAGAPDFKPATILEERAITTRGQVRLRIVRPLGSDDALPVLMFFHGGGWVYGSLDSHERLARDIAVAGRCAVAMVDYTLAPEARFPHQIEQAHGACLWLVEHAARLNLDGARIAVGGDSAGGNMAAAVALMSKQHGAPNLSAQVLLYPVTTHRQELPSYDAFRDGYLLTTAGVTRSWDAYAPDPAARESVLAAPLSASIEQLRGLPPALLITGELDVLRDEVEAYGRRLMEAGVAVVSVRYLGMIHAFLNIGALAASPSAKMAIAQVGAFLNVRLQRSSA